MYSQDSASRSAEIGSSESRPALRQLKTRLTKDAATQLGAWMLQGNTLMADVVASSGVDWVALDTQHGLFDRTSLATCIAAFHHARIACLVRVASNDAHAIGWVLDAGADGVIIPMIESAADARLALEACRYAPLGRRSMGPFAAAARGLPFSATGDAPLCLVMIETARGVRACKEIAAVEGLDGIFVGPGDLAVSLELAPSLRAEDEKSRSAIKRISSAAAERGLILGVFAGPGADTSRWTRDGFRLIAVTSDVASLRAGITSELTATASRLSLERQSTASHRPDKDEFMIDLHFFPTPNGYEASIMLEEVGFPYQVHPVNILAGEQFRPEYLAINPNNKIPAIVAREAPDGKAHPVFETGAILIYLAEKSGKLLPSNPVARSRALQWLMFQMSNIGPTFSQLAHFQVFAPEKIPYAIERFRAETTRLYGVLERRLAGNAFLAGEEYSIADIATFPWTTEMVRGWHAFDWGPYPNVQRWHASIAARPAVQRGLAVSISS